VKTNWNLPLPKSWNGNLRRALLEFAEFICEKGKSFIRPTNNYPAPVVSVKELAGLLLFRVRFFAVLRLI
jgi:hypothetical protein